MPPRMKIRLSIRALPTRGWTWRKVVMAVLWPLPFSAPILTAAPYLELAPLLGHVSSTEAHLWAKASERARLSVRLSTHTDLTDNLLGPGTDLQASNAWMGQVVLTN